MKKRTLLVAVASMFLAAGAFAQTDVTPKNWKFSAMPLGTIDQDVFLKDAARIDGNLKHIVKQAFEKEGSFGLNDWGEPAVGYDQMSEDQKKMFENTYKAFQIVDGGTLGHILCYQGAESTETDSRAVKNKSGLSSLGLNMFTQKVGLDNTTEGMYRFTLSVRFILNKNLSTVSSGMYCANSGYEQLNYAGSSTGVNFTIDADPEYNDEWATYAWEVTVARNTDPNYPYPIICKWGLGYDIANKAIILLRDIKFEKITAPTLGGKVKITAENWNDTPSGTSKLAADNLIVFANANGITVIDAKNPIEVYSASGQLIEKVTPAGSSTTIPVSQKGMYIVKSGATSKKVVL